MVEKPEDTVWIGLEYFCAEGDEFWNMTDEEWNVSHLQKTSL